jgi:hypothetical protein
MQMTHTRDFLFPRAPSSFPMSGTKTFHPCATEQSSLMMHSRGIAFAENDRYDPQAFIPERHLDADHPEIDPTTWSFGFGRRYESLRSTSHVPLTSSLQRICPGKALAENSVFILIASLIWTFTFSVDESEGLIPEFSENLVRYVHSILCYF